MAADGRVFVEEVIQDRDIWLAGPVTGTASPLIRSTSDDYDPMFGPGGAIAFVTERTGYPEIWVRTGSQVRRLTYLSGPPIASIVWSGDGKRLAFLAGEAGSQAIRIIDVASGAAVLQFESSRGAVPIGWMASRDALFTLTSIGTARRLELVNLADGRRTPIPSPPLRYAATAADGGTVFAVPQGESKLLQIDALRGVVRQYRLPPMKGLVGLLAAPRAVYLIDGEVCSATVHRLELGSGLVSRQGRLQDFCGGAISLGPDGRSLAFTQARETANDLAWVRP
jgi:Tol biopolymer transport system component